MSCCVENQSKSNNNIGSKISKFISKLPMIFGVLILLKLV